MSITSTMDAISEWLRANAIEPKTVPVDAEIHVEPADATITLEQFLYDERGGLVVRGNEIVWTVATFPLLQPPPGGLLTALRRYNLQERIRRHAAVAERLAAARQEAADWRRRYEAVLAQHTALVLGSTGTPATELVPRADAGEDGQ